jgi:ribose 5-phosphate isomerase B
VTEIQSRFKKIGLASDHAGKELKRDILVFLKDKGFELVDYGVPYESTGRVDYPDFVARLAEDVSNKTLDAGIAICGTGIGMSIVANKFKGVRAASVWDEYSSRMSREHNDANILCLGARTLNYFRALDYVEVWLRTSFAGEQHKTRLEKISKIEKKNLKSS